MSKLITIKVSYIPSETGVMRSYLEDHEINCFLIDEYMAAMYPGPAVGGAKLQVMEQDAERAIQLLIEGGFAKLEDYEEHEDESPIVIIYEKLRTFFGVKNRESY